MGRLKRCRRHRSTSLGSQLIALLVALVLLLSVGLVALSWHQRGEQTMALLAAQGLRQMRHLVALGESMGPGGRQALADAVTGRNATLFFDSRATLPVPEGSHPWPHAEAFLAELMASAEGEFLSARGGQLRLWRQHPTTWKAVPWRTGGANPALVVSLAAPLADGSWLHYQVREYTRGLTLLPLAGLLLAMLLFGGFAAHRLARPLRRFAAAVEDFGPTLDTVPLPLEGPRELRRVTVAFNRMRKRLRDLVTQRQRMFVAVAHDLRTLLTRLHLRAEYIADEKQRQLAVQDLEQMNGMLTEILDYGRLGDAIAGATEPVDLVALLGTLGEAGSESWAASGVDVVFDLPTSRSAMVTGSRDALARALGNLIDNAARYGGGRVSVRLRAEPASSSGESSANWLVEITDQGPGIPAQEYERVFEPFYRLEPSRNRHTGGVGLGLTIAREIVNAHGGSLRLRSATSASAAPAHAAAGGLLVQVRLPVAPVQSSPF